MIWTQLPNGDWITTLSNGHRYSWHVLGGVRVWTPGNKWWVGIGACLTEAEATKIVEQYEVARAKGEA